MAIQTAENRIPTRFSTAVFWGKATLLKLRRGVQDVFGGVQRHACIPANTIETDFTQVLATVCSPLYTDMDGGERALQLGKAQNLRRALQSLHGMVLPSGGTFSFWKQVGRATRRRGYAPGRQLREGCLFPAIGGGLCQLSNALYEAALQSGCEIVERHPHTRIVPGSAAASGRDAAIAWNYIDFRFRAAVPLCLEIYLTSEELIVRFLGESPSVAASKPAENSPSALFDSASSLLIPSSNSLYETSSLRVKADSTLKASSAAFIPLTALAEPRPILNPREHDCVTCGVSACFRHDAPDIRALRTQAAAGGTIGRTAYLVDEYMPELDAYLREQRTKDDLLLIPFDGTRWKQGRYRWTTVGYARVASAALPTLLRAFRSRYIAQDGPARRQAQLEGAERLAAYFARAIPWEASRIVVAQSLLPYLWRGGLLGGRTFDVLMTRLPMDTLQARLDAAFAAHPERTLLRDFRADATLVQAERAALNAARHIITPHSDVAAQFPHQAVKLDWQMPHRSAQKANGLPRGGAIAFPGPTHARKGAYEVRAIARALNLEVVLLGGEMEDANFWQGVHTRRVPPSGAQSGRRDASQADWLEGVGVVVQPAVVEEKPRRLLETLARGIPVIATSACGLDGLPGVITVPVGDEDALCQAISHRVCLQKGMAAALACKEAG